MSVMKMILEIITPEDTWVAVSPETYKALSLEVASLEPGPPKPPIKRRSTSTGFFHRGSSIEYDTQCPDYLSRLRAYRERPQGYQILTIYGPWGPVEVKVGK